MTTLEEITNPTGAAPAPPPLETPKKSRKPHKAKEPGAKTSTEFNTPQEIVDVVLATIPRIDGDARPIGFDPASNPRSIVPAKYAVFTPENAAKTGRIAAELAAFGVLVGDGLVVTWTDVEGPGTRRSFFVNAPYNLRANKLWSPKIGAEGALARSHGADGFALVQCNPGCLHFRPYWTADVLCFIDHRVCFIDGETGLVLPGANFDSVLCYWGANDMIFTVAAEKIGRCVPGRR